MERQFLNLDGKLTCSVQLVPGMHKYVPSLVLSPYSISAINTVVSRGKTSGKWFRGWFLLYVALSLMRFKWYLSLVKEYEVIIIGGGLAGLTAALHLAGRSFSVLVLEKHPYPRHKVCGEYLSNEVKPYLQSLGVKLDRAIAINRFQLAPLNGRGLITRLPLGGMGISRYDLDYQLYSLAVENEVRISVETVTAVHRNRSGYTVTTHSNTYHGKLVIGAYGKRDNLDRQLQRPFIANPSPWLAVKAHYHYPSWPDDLVGLFAFSGGYAGLSKTESGAVNLCYLASYRSFRHYGSIEKFNAGILVRNPFLEGFLSEARMLFSKPLSIAQIPFKKKSAVEQGILMCGDTAGLIYPLCGNGMAMAIHSGRMAAELIAKYGVSGDKNGAKLEKAYRQRWNAAFSRRLAYGRTLQALLLDKNLSALSMAAVTRSPWLLNLLIKGTHGKPGNL
jgi:flavin-dependent dehydrogenase